MGVVLVAGGATGIGLAATRAFRSRGDSVFLADKNIAAAERAANEKLSGRCTAFAADVADVNAVKASVGACVEAYGSLDCVFVNAGILRSMPLAEWTPQDWDLSMAVNLRAPFFYAQSAAPHLKQSANASLLFTSSTGAIRGHAGMPAYHASKAALIGLVRSLADELSPFGIRVNCICPGWIDTAFNQPFWSFQEDRDAALENLVGKIPARRQGTPEDVSGAILFLASPESHYITGTSLVVDGGYTAV
jgi:NAD(P)-dependent dehydrogenase (short-subunit alcohol dehydrogenase family)